MLGLTEDDVCFSAAKMYFAYGLGNALTFPLSVGATVLLMAERPTPDATFKRWTGAQKPTVFFGAPTGFAGMLASPRLPARDKVALRMCSSAGEALPGEIAQRFKQHFGCEIVDGIGSTEMLHIFISNRPGDIRYGTTGKPVGGYEIELRGEDGKPVPVGEVGDLYIKGPSTAVMYWGNPEKSADTFREGWTKSGDKYSRDADGYYTYAGRSDDMLKVSGIYVSPFEVEATLMLHPAVLEAAVIGKQDADGLTKTKAYVVCKDGQSVPEDELKAFVKERLAPYKYPRFIEFVDELPKTATGKIQRFRLREQGEDSASGTACPRCPRGGVTRHSNSPPSAGGGKTCASNMCASHRDAPMRHCSSSCTKASALSRCGRTFPSACARRAVFAAWCSRDQATADRRRARPMKSGTSTSCTSKLTKCFRRSSRPSA